MSVRKLPDNKVTKDGRAYAFYINEYGLDGKRHQHQSKAYMTYEEAVQAEKDYINKYKDIEINPHITFYQAYQKVYDYKKDKIRPTTLKTYRDRIVFMKLFWDVELVDLDSDLYQRWRNQLNKTNLSDRYKTDIQKLIKTICNFAEKIWPFPNVIPEEDLSSESYNLLDDIDEFDFSSTKPLKYKFDDEEEVHVNNWSVLYQGFMDKLYNLNKDAFVSFMSDENYCGTTRSMLSKNADDLRYAGSISDGYYIEMNQNTMRKIKILRTLLIDMGYDNSTLVVYVVPA